MDDAPIVRFVNKLLLDAIKQGVSDIHVECYEKMCRIRYRIDGVLTPVISPPLKMVNQLISRIKVMSKMDIAERRLPQDGRIAIFIEKFRDFCKIFDIQNSFWQCCTQKNTKNTSQTFLVT